MEYNTNAPPDQGASAETWAQWYVSLGLSVFPVWGVDNSGTCRCRKGAKCPSPGKHPRTPQGIHAATTDPAKLGTWKWSTANVGIATGPKSGILVLDVDGQAGWKSYDELKRKLGPLVESGAPAKVITSKGGAHAYVAYPEGLAIPSRAGIAEYVDIRAEGGYVVAPPSWHASGHVYAFDPWIWPLPQLSSKWADFLATHGTPSPLGEFTERQKIQKDTEETEAAPQNGILTNEIRTFIQRYLPKTTGTRNKQIFELARAIKGLPRYADADAMTLLPLVQYWHGEGIRRGVIETQTFDDTMADWLNSWPKVKFPKGEDPMTRVVQLAQQKKPQAAKQFDTEAVRLLVGICYHLQKATGDNPFFLSCRKAGEIIQVSHVQASKYLSMLVSVQLLKLVGKAEPGPGQQAQRYFWIGGE
jgi:hypothetical protein